MRILWRINFNKDTNLTFWSKSYGWNTLNNTYVIGINAGRLCFTHWKKR